MSPLSGKLFRQDIGTLFRCNDVHTSICPTVGGTLAVPPSGRVTENYISEPGVIPSGSFSPETRATDIISVLTRGRRREPALSPARGGWLQLPVGLRLGRDLRHGLHQQSEEGEECWCLV